jgi:hypothetical protein
MAPSKDSGKEVSTISQSTLFDLKGIVSEHRSTFDKEGRIAVKGRVRPQNEALVSDLESSRGIGSRLTDRLSPGKRQIRSSVTRYHQANGNGSTKRPKPETPRTHIESFGRTATGDHADQGGKV